MSNRYEIVRQDVNCGPVRRVFVATLSEANRAFDAALAQGAIFAEVFDMVTDAQVRVEYPRPVWA